MTPSQIGVSLRDQHGIPQVRFITGKKILRILRKQGRHRLKQDPLQLSQRTCTCSSRRPSP